MDCQMSGPPPRRFPIDLLRYLPDDARSTRNRARTPCCPAEARKPQMPHNRLHPRLLFAVIGLSVLSLAAFARAQVRSAPSVAQRQVHPDNEREQDVEERTDNPDQAIEWRLMRMRDEHGQIPDGALMRATAADGRDARRADHAAATLSRHLAQLDGARARQHRRPRPIDRHPSEQPEHDIRRQRRRRHLEDDERRRELVAGRRLHGEPRRDVDRVHAHQPGGHVRRDRRGAGRQPRDSRRRRVQVHRRRNDVEPVELDGESQLLLRQSRRGLARRHHAARCDDDGHLSQHGRRRHVSGGYTGRIARRGRSRRWCSTRTTRARRSPAPSSPRRTRHCPRRPGTRPTAVRAGRRSPACRAQLVSSWPMPGASRTRCTHRSTHSAA